MKKPPNKGAFQNIKFDKNQAAWQLDGRYFANIEPPHVQVTTPVESRVGVKIIVLPVIFVSPLAVAVTIVPFQVTPLT